MGNKGNTQKQFDEVSPEMELGEVAGQIDLFEELELPIAQPLTENVIDSSTSLPSKPVTYLDIPEIKSFNASFVYNFFVNDESVNGTGQVPNKFNQKTSLNADFFNSVDLNRFIPRYVKFEFKPPTLIDTTIGNEFVKSTPEKRETSIVKNIKSILSEEKFSDFNFVGLEFQDNTIDGKLYFLVSSSLASRLNKFKEEDRSSGTDITDFTLMGASNALNDLISEDVDGNVIASVSSQRDKKGTSFIDNQNKEIINETFEDLKNVSLRMQINSNRVHDIINSLVKDSVSSFADEFASSLSSRFDFGTIKRSTEIRGKIRNQ